MLKTNDFCKEFNNEDYVKPDQLKKNKQSENSSLRGI